MTIDIEATLSKMRKELVTLQKEMKIIKEESRIHAHNNKSLINDFQHLISIVAERFKNTDDDLVKIFITQGTHIETNKIRVEGLSTLLGEQGLPLHDFITITRTILDKKLKDPGLSSKIKLNLVQTYNKEVLDVIGEPVTEDSPKTALSYLLIDENKI